jgi:hypothetical protein
MSRRLPQVLSGLQVFFNRIVVDEVANNDCLAAFVARFCPDISEWFLPQGEEARDRKAAAGKAARAPAA